MATELKYIGKIIGDRGTDGPKGYGWAYGSGAPSSNSTEIGPYNNSPANLYLDITTGNIYRKDANTPFIWYFNIILDNVTPNVNPLKNNINITTSTPIIEIPRAKINSNCK